MSRRAYRLIIVIGLLGLGALALWYWTRPQPISVSLYTVDKGLVEVTVANTRAGTIKACRRAKLAPATGGQVSRLAVKKGDKVKTGQILLALWNEDIAAQVKLAENSIVAAKAKTEEACLTADNAGREADRLVKLRQSGLVSEEVVDRAVSESQARQAACRAARALAEVSASQLDVAKAALERTFLRAPFNGVVAEVNGEIGEFVTPSPTGILTPPAIDLIDMSCLYISAPIDEVDTQAIRPGMPARISLDVMPGRIFEGRVSRTAPYVLEAEKQARTIDVEATFTNPGDYASLVPGYSADVEIILDVRPDVIRVPTEAVLEGGKLLVYHPDSGMLEERSVKTGKSNWKFTEIVSGVLTGEQVVLSVDRAGVKAGAYAKPEAATAPARTP